MFQSVLILFFHRILSFYLCYSVPLILDVHELIWSAPFYARRDQAVFQIRISRRRKTLSIKSEPKKKIRKTSRVARPVFVKDFRPSPIDHSAGKNRRHPIVYCGCVQFTKRKFFDVMNDI